MPYLENISYFGTLLITEVQWILIDDVYRTICSKNINVNFFEYMNVIKDLYLVLISGRKLHN